MGKSKRKSKGKMSPIVWNSPEIKAAYNKKYTKGKLTFFKISNPEGDLDFLLSGKMLKHRKIAAKRLYKSAKKHYKSCRKELASVGNTKLSNKKIQKLEKQLVTAKMIKAQAKDYFKRTKADLRSFRLKS